MPLAIPKTRKPPVETRVFHEGQPDQVKITFRRVGFTTRTRMEANAGANFGQVVDELLRAGTGVEKWEGIYGPDRDDGSQGPALDYSPSYVDAIAEASPEFGAWFTRNLLDVAGFLPDGTPKPQGDTSGGDTLGNGGQPAAPATSAARVSGSGSSSSEAGPSPTDTSETRPPSDG